MKEVNITNLEDTVTSIYNRRVDDVDALLVRQAVEEIRYLRESNSQKLMDVVYMENRYIRKIRNYVYATAVVSSLIGVCVTFGFLMYKGVI